MDSSSPIGIYVPNWLLHHQLTVKTEESTMKISRVGVDLAKNVFQLHGVDRHGETVLKRRLSREK
jgi:transposase